MNTKKFAGGVLCMILLLLGGFELFAQCCGSCGGKTAPKKEAEVKKEVKYQTTCPVMGGKINKALFADVKGYRIYVCCKGCLKMVEADPDKYIAKVKANGEEPYKTPAQCKKCRKVKGSPECCKPPKK